MSLLIAVLLAAAAAALTPGRVPLALGIERTPPLGPDSGRETRCEYFVIEGPAEYAEGVSGPRRPEALVAFRRVDAGHDLLLERDVFFREGAVQVLHDERARTDTFASERLVFRELRGEAAPGRTWIADWDTERAGLRTLTWGARGRVHGWRPGDERPVAPLALIEELRLGPAPDRGLSRLDPLRRAAERVRLIERAGDPNGLLGTPAGGPGAGSPRTVDVRRMDGSLAARYVLRGADLVAFQWQDGARRARRIDADEYRAKLEAWHPVLGTAGAAPSASTSDR